MCFLVIVIHFVPYEQPLLEKWIAEAFAVHINEAIRSVYPNILFSQTCLAFSLSTAN